MASLATSTAVWKREVMSVAPQVVVNRLGFSLQHFPDQRCSTVVGVDFSSRHGVFLPRRDELGWFLPWAGAMRKSLYRTILMHLRNPCVEIPPTLDSMWVSVANSPRGSP
jgi:hypothetical protein